MIPFHAEAVLGWRVWLVRDGRLVSWSQDAAWPTGERLQARCRRLLRTPCPEAPGRGHACGIYAVRTREAAEAILAELPLPVAPVVIGRASLWGRVMENVGGWRAQYAYPYELFVRGGSESLVRELRRAYRVDVVAA